MLDENQVEDKMVELARVLKYEYDSISWLKKAMRAEKIKDKKGGKNRKNHTNDALATLGDSVLKLVLTEYFFDDKEDKGYITQEKGKIEDNDTLFELFNKLKLYKFAYNDNYFYEESPAENKVSNSKHNQYIEAIIGAIYKDKGWDYVKKWAIDFLMANEVLSKNPCGNINGY